MGRELVLVFLREISLHSALHLPPLNAVAALLLLPVHTTVSSGSWSAPLFFLVLFPLLTLVGLLYIVLRLWQRTE